MNSGLIRNALIAVGVTAAAVWYARYTVQSRKLDEIVREFAEIQKLAFDQPMREVPPVGIPTPLTDPPEGAAFRTIDSYQFLYVIDRCDDGDYLHHVVGRHENGAAGPLSECMLLIMRRLVQEFAPAGLEHEVMLHVEVLESGTQHIDFALRPEQHAALASALNLQVQS